MTSATLTVGTIQRGARAGARTTLASMIDRLVLSARTRINLLFKYQSYNFIDNFNRPSRHRVRLLLNIKATKVRDIFDPL
jgi:hypothetical protein